MIPAFTRTYEQICRRDIVPDTIPGFDCSVARGTHPYTAGGTHKVWFNVLGAHPTDLGVEVLWVNHYPIDLHLLWNTEASNTTALHVSDGNN